MHITVGQAKVSWIVVRKKRYVFDIARFIEVKAPHNISVEDLEDLVNEEALRMIESGDIRWTPIIEEEIN